MTKKKQSQLFTYSEILKNNKEIFSKQFSKQHDEPEEHYICKIFLGEMLRKYYSNKYYMVISYEHQLPALETGNGFRSYIPDIYIESINHKDRVINIADIEVNGLVHYKNKKQYQKNKVRRETIITYFKDKYLDISNPEYEIVFSYIVFERDDFLYNKFDFFQKIFEENFIGGGVYPKGDSYEKYLLR